MKRTRMLAALVTVLAATACGSTTTPATGPITPTDPACGSRCDGPTAQAWAKALLGHVRVPSGAKTVSDSPANVLNHLPAFPAMSSHPVTLRKWWTVKASTPAVTAWLRQHNSGFGKPSQGGSPAWLGYQHTQKTLPPTIGVSDLFLVVASAHHGVTGIAAFAMALKQPPRPSAEDVPRGISQVAIGWRIAPGGTPVQKVLTGSDAAKLVSDFNALRVSTLGEVPCPMMTPDSDITVTFTTPSHTWKADVVLCPAISVTRDGHSLPGLAFDHRFLADIKMYSGHLPRSGPPESTGGMTPLGSPSTTR